MAVEVKLLNERAHEYGYGDIVRQHVARSDAPNTPLCGHVGKHVGEGSSVIKDDKKLCAPCILAATLKAAELVAIARSAEDLIERLRADYNSLTTHGPITRAMGQLYKAADELMHEAKERALAEVMPR